MAEKIVMTNSEESTAALFGAFDINARIIEESFGVRITEIINGVSLPQQ